MKTCIMPKIFQNNKSQISIFANAEVIQISILQCKWNKKCGKW